ncbi:MAG: cytochrome P450 [Rhizobiaceae bacterium]
MKPPIFEIEPISFAKDPYPTLKEMRATAPICFVPQLNAILFTKRDDIFTCEKMIDVFSSEQPGGLMTVLMGENMMRKDGEPHSTERKEIFPAISPRTVRDVWKQQFEHDTKNILDQLSAKTNCELVTDFAMPVSGHALCHVTGLTNFTPEQMDSASQGMIDGIGNYAGDAAIETKCHEATKLIDNAIDEMLPELKAEPNTSILSILTRAGQSMDSERANIKLAISGGQNEPRDAIAGCVWALLKHPDQLAHINKGEATWQQAFEEYARWISPIGMSPRRVAKPFVWNGIDFAPESRVFFMYGSANRDEGIFNAPESFDITRSTAKAISFGAGPHFCAGAATARTLISEVALPMLFDRFKNLSLNGDADFSGWAFRGPLSVPVNWV